MDAFPEIIVVGVSAGGTAALQQLFAGLPADFPVPILVTKHIGAFNGALPQILQRTSKLPVHYATHDAPIVAGQILIAPADRHLLVVNGKTELSSGAKENFSRPAIDPLFRTAAMAYREKAIGVILTGYLDDGTVGLQAIKTYGGISVVQDPESADAPSMPLSALQYAPVDYCVSMAEMPALLIRLAQTAVQPAAQSAERTEDHAGLTQELDMHDLQKVAQPSTYTCPECSGALWELRNVKPQRFRCHTGHAYTIRSLQQAQDQGVNDALWSALRALHEKELLMMRMAQLAKDSDNTVLAEEYLATAKLSSQQGATLRGVLNA